MTSTTSRSVQLAPGKFSRQSLVLHRGSPEHGLHFQHVTVASVPEAYAERLVEPFRGRFGNLRLLVVEAHDLALSKPVRNTPVDRFDVAHLAKTAPLDPEVLQTRYRRELRPGSLLGDPDTHDRTLQMWIESYFQPHEGKVRKP